MIPVFGQAASSATIVLPAATMGRNYGCRSRSGVNDNRCPPGVNRQFHNGLDIAAPEGSPVYSPMPGEVLANVPNGVWSRYGNCLLIGTYDQHTLLFAHLRELAKNEETGRPWAAGDIVRRGQAIARVGATGACHGWPRAPARTGPGGVPCTNCGAFLCGYPVHLHFEVIPGYTTRPNPRGRRIDPRSYAREKGFYIHSGGGSGGAGLGELPTTTDPFAFTPDKYQYFDPHGFEPMDDEPEVTGAFHSRAAKWVVGGTIAFVALATAVAVLRA